MPKEPLADPLTQADSWQRKISAAWQKSVESIIETGLLLIDAKAELEHGHFLEMLESELPFGPNTAQRLMIIASDDRITNAAHVQLLPAKWGTIYELTKLPDGTFEQAILSGKIHPRMERKDVFALLSPPKPTTPIESAPPDDESTNDTPEQRWQLSLGNHAGDAIALRAYLTHEFGNWERFERPSSLRMLARHAANAWTELANKLEQQPIGTGSAAEP
jgi:hypothetical protein